jgi:hypothetical protein
VMMVVAVLITNCHVSLNRNNGPVTIHTPMVQTAKTNTMGLPQKREADLAN